MQNILVHAHSGLRWILLALLIVAVLRTAGGMSGGKSFTDSIRKTALFTLVATHIQLLLGLVLYFTSPKVVFGSDTMSDSVLRFFAVEHSLMMLIGVVLVTLGYRSMKSRATDTGKYKAVFWYYLIALVIILAGIPWPFRGLGNWF